MKNLKYFILSVTFFVLISFIGCGDDETTNSSNNGNYPTINMKQGSVYTFTFDTLDQNGNPTRLANITSQDSIGASVTYQSQTAIPLYTRTDSSGHISNEITYVRYDASTGKFYQWGIARLLDSTQTGSWDLVADYSVSQGTEWHMLTTQYHIGTFTIDAVINAKVAADTTFHSTGTPSQPITCKRSEIRADLSITSIPVGKIYFDYFIGYQSSSTNPSGWVRLKLRPINITFGSSTLLRAAGLDRIIKTFVIP